LIGIFGERVMEIIKIIFVGNITYIIEKEISFFDKEEKWQRKN